MPRGQERTMPAGETPAKIEGIIPRTIADCRQGARRPYRAVVLREHDRVRPRVDAELLEDPCHVVADRLLADEQLAADVEIGRPAREQVSGSRVRAPTASRTRLLARLGATPGEREHRVLEALPRRLGLEQDVIAPSRARRTSRPGSRGEQLARENGTASSWRACMTSVGTVTRGSSSTTSTSAGSDGR